MRNGQLKPGYNVNVATCSDFIIGSYISSDRNDVHTLIPFMEQLRKNYAGRNIGSVVVDSGYESEENYCWFEAHFLPKGLPASGEPFYSGRRQLCICEVGS